MAATARSDGSRPARRGAGREVHLMDHDEARQPLARDHIEVLPAGSLPPGPARHDRDDGRAALSDIGAVTDRGLRHHRNEDAVELRLLGPQPAIVVVVADGVSSSVDPDQASELAARVAADELSERLATQSGPPSPDQLAAEVSTAIVAARQAVAGLAGPDAHAESAPATTLVVAAVAGGLVVIGWLGDSRAYWIPSVGAAVPLTWDDSWAAEAISAGAPPDAAYRLPQAHAITAWLGHEAPALDPHLVALAPALVDAGGVLIVCSDGLWNYLTDDAELADTVREQAGDALTAGDTTAIGLAGRLVAWAIGAGGGDNISVAVIPAAAIRATA